MGARGGHGDVDGEVATEQDDGVVGPCVDNLTNRRDARVGTKGPVWTGTAGQSHLRSLQFHESAGRQVPHAQQGDLQEGGLDGGLDGQGGRQDLAAPCRNQLAERKQDTGYNSNLGFTTTMRGEELVTIRGVPGRSGWKWKWKRTSMDVGEQEMCEGDPCVGSTELHEPAFPPAARVAE